jgi:uncharacterized protein
MALVNKTNKAVLAKSVKVCKSAWSKANGLMFSREAYVLKHPLVFIFDKARSQGLHMFFVFYPIDVLFLDDKKCIVEMKQMFWPFTLYNSKRQAKYVIELPQGSIRRSKTGLGHVISW